MANILPYKAEMIRIQSAKLLVKTKIAIRIGICRGGEDAMDSVGGILKRKLVFFLDLSLTKTAVE